MTVSTTTSRADYTGNGTTTAFTVPFYFLDNTHLKVIRTQVSTGIATTLALTTDYTVSGAGSGSGGTVTMVSAPTSDQRISVLRNIPFTQLVHYVENSPFPAATHEQALDQLTMEVQQLNEQASRALTLNPNTAGGSTTLPAPSANALIGWNAGATALQNVNPVALATLVAFGTANADIFTGDGSTKTFTLSANPGAQANLDVSVGGVTQYPSQDYTWVGGQSLTFGSAPPNGVKILARYFQGLPQGYADWNAVTNRPFVDVKTYGAKGDGTTDDTAAFLVAAATGKAVYVPFGEYLVTGLVLSTDACFFSDCQFLARLKLKANSNTHVIKTTGDVKLTLHRIGIDGNYANQTLAPNYPCGVLVPVGSLRMTDCYVFNVINHAIHTGNTDWDYNASNYAHDISLIGNLVVQPSSAVGDCIRIHRTLRGVIANNHTQGGLSSIRSNYYCDKLVFTGNLCRSNYGDVGITAALSTDIAITGNTCTGNGQHGIECDGVVRGVISGNVCTGNTKHGIMLTEYGPPSGSNYSGSVDGTGISYPTVMSNKDVQVTANTCSTNGQSGIHAIGQARVDIKDNTLVNNNTSNAGYAGLYIVGGTLNQDDVLVAGNTFTNVGYQTQSILQSNVQGQTRTGGNTHTTGTPQWQYAVRGTPRNSLTQDPTLLLSSSVATTPGSVVEDTTARTKYARQINDTNGTGNLTINCLIPAVPLTGDKYIIVRLRTPDTMTKCTLSIQLYLGAGFVATFASSAITTLSSAWSEYKYRVPDSQKSTPFDNIKVQIDTDVVLTGKINIESVECYTTTEL